MNIYVSNLGFSINDAELNKLFASYGVVKSAKVIVDKLTNQSRGFGFVEMTDENAAQAALKGLNGTMVEGRALKVNEARPREEQNNNRSSFKRW
ncbi:MAG: RNA-binding protein [Bacteroidetes bacterium]|nr:RNA-binding protein [Bacteroidota bacterium]MBS1935861.1 RNA-binding protein [Bacteroidota bacterium]